MRREMPTVGKIKTLELSQLKKKKNKNFFKAYLTYHII